MGKTEHMSYVELAAKWLSARYPIVATEIVSGAGEIPDAIGMDGNRTHVIECKTSRSDFFADLNKPWRKGLPCFGSLRSFLCPKGMISTKELPEGWGLIEYNNGKLMQVLAPLHNTDHDWRKEYILLISILRRIGQNPPEGVSIKCYTIETQRTATVGIEPETIEKLEG